MEVDEEYEEKVNLMDLLLPESSEERQKYILYGENFKFSSPLEESMMPSVSSRCVQEKYSNIESKYGIKELKVILKRLVLPVSAIKQEKLNEDDNSCPGSPQEDDSCNSDDSLDLGNVLNGGNQSIHDIKKETLPIEESHCVNNDLRNVLNVGIQSITNIKKEMLPIEESHCNKTLHENQLTVRVLRNRKSSVPINQSPNQCVLRNRKSSVPINQSPNQCDLCKYVFGVTSSFLDHMKICNKSNNICRTILLSVIDSAITEKITEDKEMVDRRYTPFRFVCCDKIFTTFLEFNSHKLSTHNIELLVCGLCSCRVVTVQILYKHYKTKHFPGLYIHLKYPEEEYPSTAEECTAEQQGILCQCPACDRKHSTETSDKPTVSRPYACKICKMTFAFRKGLKRHETTHLGLKTFPCNICAMSFTKRLTLDRHKLTQHSSEPSPFKVPCSICSKELASKSSLNKHIRNVHSGGDKMLPRVSCPHCPKTFSAAKQLSRHIKSHLLDEEYTCADCNRTFYCKPHLLNHIKSQHLPKELFKCDICGYETNTNVKIHFHKIKKHSDWRYSCDKCGKRFSTKSNLENHQVTHSDDKPFVCQVCGKAFKREGNLDQHQYTHSDERPHLCSICGQAFRLRTHVKQHMAVHGVGENHKCLLCNKSFARKRELNVHMLSHGVC